jgi:hypothetical protein
MIGIALPIAAAVVLEQLPKTGVARVPFAFQVQGETLPAGTYSVKQTVRGRAVCLENQKLADSARNCVAAKSKFGKAEGSRLVFSNYEGHYVLSEIWFEADGAGLILQNRAVPSDASLRDAPEIRNVHFE